MKTKTVSLLLTIAFCFLFAGCNQAKHPLDWPDSTWVCEEYGIGFSVSEEGKITNATMTDKHGNTFSASLVFGNDNAVSITNADKTEVYISGIGFFDKTHFHISINDVFNNNLDIHALRINFKRV